VGTDEEDIVEFESQRIASGQIVLQALIVVMEFISFVDTRFTR
jgi:hypothetical protein